MSAFCPFCVLSLGGVMGVFARLVFRVVLFIVLWVHFVHVYEVCV